MICLHYLLNSNDIQECRRAEKRNATPTPNALKTNSALQNANADLDSEEMDFSARQKTQV
jgi:hypothetical protein